MTEYKVGDKVEVLIEDVDFPVGDIITITRIYMDFVGAYSKKRGRDGVIRLRNIRFFEEPKAPYVIKEGDLIEQAMTCSEAIAGKQYIVAKRLNGDSRLIVNEHGSYGCMCPHLWKLIKEAPQQTESMERKEDEKRMQSTIQVGSQVRATKGCNSVVTGQIYTVHESDGEYYISKDGEPYRLCTCAYSWELIKETVPAKNVMQKLNILAKKFLDPETKTLVKAGILSNCLEVTAEGQAFINTFIMGEFKTKIAAAAKELLKEQKEEKEEDK